MITDKHGTWTKRFTEEDSHCSHPTCPQPEYKSLTI